jgi:hypothetical protein
MAAVESSKTSARARQRCKVEPTALLELLHAKALIPPTMSRDPLHLLACSVASHADSCVMFPKRAPVRAVCGRIINLAGEKLNNVDLTLTGETGSVLFTTRSDTKGSFSVGSIPKGDYTLHAKAPGYRVAERAIRVTHTDEKKCSPKISRQQWSEIADQPRLSLLGWYTRDRGFISKSKTRPSIYLQKLARVAAKRRPRVPRYVDRSILPRYDFDGLRRQVQHNQVRLLA